MPLLPRDLIARADVVLEQLESTAILAERKVAESVHHLIERVNIPFNNVTSPPGLIEANTRDPWSKSGKYALGWVYFSIILLAFASLLRLYSHFTDRIRTALRQEEVQHPKSKTYSPESEYSYAMSNLYTDKSPNTAVLAEHPIRLSSAGDPRWNVGRLHDTMDYRDVDESESRFTHNRHWARETECSPSMDGLRMSLPEPCTYRSLLHRVRSRSDCIRHLQNLL